ncbi:large conductance mechanosensitive channel protein MscL [Lapidilactobacillus luobeiensis]|uniref:large conductance mechanosensitive channel protein MscL n=1 Tax=Lapidilactobacillus luobeiensis TaxID=2950371 RepID=UPI0021C3C743|nr:large conductance mechanosensitive channel protein MscL [Lapidilactobacillus luobeiensis]
MLKEFREFISRGNVIDMAIGVLIGGAFNGLVASLTKNVLSPLIGIFTRSVDLSSISFQVGAAKFTIGSFLNDVIQFLIMMFVIFLIVKSFNKLRDLTSGPAEEEAVPVSAEEQYLKEIRDLLQAQQNTTPDQTNKIDPKS